MQERYIKWWTPYLSREFEMLVFGNGGGLPLIIFPTSFGNYRQNKDFGLIDSVAWFVDNNRVTVYARMRLISTVFTTNRFTLPIGFALTSPTKTLSCVKYSISRGAKAAPTGSGSAAQVWARITPPTSLSGMPTPSVILSA